MPPRHKPLRNYLRRVTGSSPRALGNGSATGMLKNISALLLTFVLLVPVLAQQPVSPSSLPPEAEEAVRKGFVAADAQNYSLAARYFEEARTFAPAAPSVLLNLGVAES